MTHLHKTNQLLKFHKFTCPYCKHMKRVLVLVQRKFSSEEEVLETQIFELLLMNMFVTRNRRLLNNPGVNLIIFEGFVMRLATYFKIWTPSKHDFCLSY